ncbi:hypothetical protein NCC78_04895 [Micromonospora phytophila]|uniref:hypothetical protein n=1 Tax=Micromonospora phytophila TaxID=709888 RepID=UPI00203058E4|nr:hypothetical protein [Micromonospora phytophila]MCM0674040.1 hypothetical protein [Micromonospora phytophila]
MSLLIAGVALVLGVLVVVDHDQPVGAALFLLLALLLGSSLIVIAIRRWLSGHTIPASLGLAGLVLLFGGSVVVNLVVGSGGFVIAASGTVAGMLLANVWAISAARANRPPNLHEREPTPEHRPSAPDEPEPAPEPATHAGVSGKDCLSFVLEAKGGLVLIGDRDHRDSPIWDEGAAAAGAISDGKSVLVGTRAPGVGAVRVQVSVGQVPPAGGHQVFAGRLDLPSGAVEAGNILVHHVEKLDISPARSAFFRIFVDSRESPARVTVLVAPE